MIKGMTIKLYVKTQTGTDGFGRPVYSEAAVDVDNVLVGIPESREIIDTLALTGKRAVYTLGIPKGDGHDWKDADVEIFGERFHTIGPTVQGIESMVPLEWNRKVQVEWIG